LQIKRVLQKTGQSNVGVNGILIAEGVMESERMEVFSPCRAWFFSLEEEGKRKFVIISSELLRLEDKEWYGTFGEHVIL